MTGPLMIDIAGTRLLPEDIHLLKNPLVGGLIFFSRNFNNAPQIFDLAAEIKSIRPDIIIAVDQEGGRVQRFKEGYTQLPAMATLGNLYIHNPEQALMDARLTGWLMASELICSGIDISFAPVLDIEAGISEVIGDRAFSDKAETVIEVARAFICGMHDAGMAATGKHFPGHGSIAADSHLTVPVDKRPVAEIMNHDILPFKALSGLLQAVMPAHVIYSKVCQDAAGFSHYWLKECLRGELGFDGVIFSDDLNMEGARTAGSFAESAEAALKAGCDMILICNNRPAALEILKELKKLDKEKSLLDNPRLKKMLACPEQKQTLPELQGLAKWREAVAIAGLHVQSQATNDKP